MIARAVLLLALSAAAAPAAAQSVHVVAPETLIVHEMVYAEVEGVERPIARARISGLIETLDLDEGERVEAGDILALVIDPELDAQRAAARGDLDQARAERAAAAAEQARIQALFEAGNASRARLDEANRRLNAAQGAQAAVEGRLARLEAQAARGAVLAPATGVILQVFETPGSAVDRGAPIALIAAAPARLRLAAPERFAETLRLGDALSVEIAGARFDAQIVQVYPEILAGRVEADLALPEAAAGFIGRRAAVALETDRRAALLIPAAAVQARAGLSFVTLESGEARLVRIGDHGAEHVEVLAGLAAGDRIRLP